MESIEIRFHPLIVIIWPLLGYLGYKLLWKGRSSVKLEKMHQDMTLEELKSYNGSGPDGRILVAVRGNIYDVSKAKNFYGPGGSYAAFAGKDASRGLATFKVSVSDREYDDLSDLTTKEIESLTKWEDKFKEKYDLVGCLLKPGGLPMCYPTLIENRDASCS